MRLSCIRFYQPNNLRNKTNYVSCFIMRVFGVLPMVPFVGNICTICTNLIANGTNGKEIGANGKKGNGYVRGSPNGKICKSTNGTVGTIFTNGNQKTLNVFSDGTIGRSHGGNFIILINTPHFFVFLIYFMYIVLFITFTFACMTKVLLIYEIHDIFLGSPY